VFDVIFGGLAAGDFFCYVELRRNTEIGYLYCKLFCKKLDLLKEKKRTLENSSRILPKLCPFCPFQILFRTDTGTG
jgi:hypothetical protein